MHVCADISVTLLYLIVCLCSQKFGCVRCAADMCIFLCLHSVLVLFPTQTCSLFSQLKDKQVKKGGKKMLKENLNDSCRPFNINHAGRITKEVYYPAQSKS